MTQQLFLTADEYDALDARARRNLETEGVTVRLIEEGAEDTGAGGSEGDDGAAEPSGRVVSGSQLETLVAQNASLVAQNEHLIEKVAQLEGLLHQIVDALGRARMSVVSGPPSRAPGRSFTFIETGEGTFTIEETWGPSAPAKRK